MVADSDFFLNEFLRERVWVGKRAGDRATERAAGLGMSMNKPMFNPTKGMNAWDIDRQIGLEEQQH